MPFLHVGRGLLAETYEALGRVEEAARFRDEYEAGIAEQSAASGA